MTKRKPSRFSSSHPGSERAKAMLPCGGSTNQSPTSYSTESAAWERTMQPASEKTMFKPLKAQQSWPFDTILYLFTNLIPFFYNMHLWSSMTYIRWKTAPWTDSSRKFLDPPGAQNGFIACAMLQILMANPWLSHWKNPWVLSCPVSASVSLSIIPKYQISMDFRIPFISPCTSNWHFFCPLPQLRTTGAAAATFTGMRQRPTCNDRICDGFVLWIDKAPVIQDWNRKNQVTDWIPGHPNWTYLCNWCSFRLWDLLRSQDIYFMYLHVQI